MEVKAQGLSKVRSLKRDLLITLELRSFFYLQNNDEPEINLPSQPMVGTDDLLVNIANNRVK